MTLSVIMPCHNAAETIAAQLDALAGQACAAPWELIVADNGSSDDTRDIVEGYRSRIPALRWIDASAKRGPAYARNRGVEAARGDRFAFCDADDEVAPGWLAAIAQALSAHPFVVSRMDDAKLNPSWLREIWGSPEEALGPLFGFLPGAAAYGIGFTRELYARVGPFDESLRRMSDIDYSWRVQLAGYPLARVPDALVYYRHRRTVTGLFRQAYADGQAQVLLYKKHRANGMPWPPISASVRGWIGMARRLPALRRQIGRAEWLIDAGVGLGHVRGSMRHGVLAL